MSAACLHRLPQKAECTLPKRKYGDPRVAGGAVRVFGSYAKGNPYKSSDIDIAVSADAGHYVALVEKWERNLTDLVRPTVHIRDFLRNEAICACDECSLLLFPQSAWSTGVSSTM
jgi:predicted nucleotidyltransferase